MKRFANIERGNITARCNLDGSGVHKVDTGYGFFDHMLSLFSVHGLLDLNIDTIGETEANWLHTIEDVGSVLGDIIHEALGDRRSISRYGHAVIPMDDSLAKVSVDLSNRPYLVFRLPENMPIQNVFDTTFAKTFFRVLAQHGGMNIHIQVSYGENWHHMIEAVFKGFGRALRQGISLDPRVSGFLTSKGIY